MRTRLLSIALLSATALTLRAQTTAPEAPSVASPAETHAEAKPAVAKGKDTLSVDFPDEEIRTVLRNVADLFELNLVIPDTLQGKTSVKLRDVTWRQIFRVVLEPVGYTFIEDANIIKVVTVESLNMEPVATEVFILNYARAADVKPSVEAMVDAKVGGKIVVDSRSNALVLSERPSAIQRIRPIILNLDKATEQVMIETKFIEVTDRDVKNIGMNWASLAGYEMGAGAFSREYTGSSGRTQTEGVAETVTGPVTTNAKSFFNDITRATSAVFSADEFKLIVSALKTLNDTKLVSNPTVVTLNNSEASINIGEEFPVPNYTYNQERGSFEVSGFVYKPIGVILKVTPQVNSAGFIKLAVEPEVSSRSGTVNFGGASGAAIPIIGVRKTRTQVSLKDGFTLGIGGLVESSKINDQSKVPVLGDIPGLGRLFRSDTKNSTTRNLIVFITARTVKPDGASVGEVFDPRMIRDMRITKDELPGFRDGSDPFYQAPVDSAKK
jgi:type IV pilus assembly protein PilQ